MVAGSRPVLLAALVAGVAGNGLCAETEGLTPAQIQSAVCVEAITVPTPGEFFAAVNKIDRPNWTQLVRTPVTLSSTDRVQIALDVGTRVADGFIAVEAQDGQRVKNTGRDIITLSKSLGVTESILARGSSISDFAENNEWNALKEELEATENEVKMQMAQQKDDGLVTLVTVGAWLRGMQAASEVVSGNYQPDSAQLLRQEAIVSYLLDRVNALPEGAQKSEFIGQVREGLGKIYEVITAMPEAPPTEEQIKALGEITNDLVNSIGGTSETSKE